MIGRCQILTVFVPISSYMSDSWDSLYLSLGMLFVIWLWNSLTSLTFSKHYFRCSFLLGNDCECGCFPFLLDCLSKRRVIWLSWRHEGWRGLLQRFVVLFVTFVQQRHSSVAGAVGFKQTFREELVITIAYFWQLCRLIHAICSLHTCEIQTELPVLQLIHSYACYLLNITGLFSPSFLRLRYYGTSISCCVQRCTFSYVVCLRTTTLLLSTTYMKCQDASSYWSLSNYVITKFHW